ncbi:hypothetical protein Plo01_57030 [Planobispora longispora]|uniref:Uncharacterized protein n=1 Tax=Planobispora longispora TaxID=28887 RepID=A0A8J3RQF0_9ACTN|nr:hypothetical protein Plo01_57030 [Planobispora longispora]
MRVFGPEDGTGPAIRPGPRGPVITGSRSGPRLSAAPSASKRFQAAPSGSRRSASKSLANAAGEHSRSVDPFGGFPVECEDGRGLPAAGRLPVHVRPDPARIVGRG